MAKQKDFGGLESKNKNIGNGINALVSSGPNQNSKEIDLAREEAQRETSYPLRIPKTTLKALKTMAAEQDTTIKELVTIAIMEKYKF